MNLSSKKGNVLLDSIVILVVLVVMGIIGILAYSTFDDLVTDISVDESFDEEARNKTLELHSRFPATMDGAFGFAFILLWLLVLVASFMIDSHPVFFAISIILMLVMLFSAGLLSNAFDEFESDIEIEQYKTDFPITSFILTNLVIFLLAVGGSVGLVLFGKSRMG